MDDKKIAKQLIDFHKATFDNTFDSLSALNVQTEKMVEGFLQQAAWLPSEGRQVINDWVNMYKKGRIDFKTAVDESYAKVEEYFSGNAAEQKTKTARKK
jgi:hypothetical protein